MELPERSRSPIPSPSLISAMQGGIISIHVGPDRKKFDVHKALLSHHSEYFHNASKEPWQEAIDGVVTLTDIEPAIFAIFLKWCYESKIPQCFDDWDAICVEADGDIEGDGGTDDIFTTAMVKAYIFGDRFLAPFFQRSVLEILVEHLNENPYPTWFHATALAFNNLPEKSPMLKALIDAHHLYYTTEPLDQRQEELAKLVPAAFWRATTEKHSETISDECEDWTDRFLDPDNY